VNYIVDELAYRQSNKYMIEVFKMVQMTHDIYDSEVSLKLAYHSDS